MKLTLRKWQLLEQHNIYLHLFGFANTSMRVNVGDIDGSIAFVAANTTSNSHTQGLSSILTDSNRLLRHLSPFYPQSFLEKLGHLTVGC